MKFKLEIDTDTAAFNSGISPVCETEIARILSDLGSKLAEGFEPVGRVPGLYGPIFDVNGNLVGEWKFTKR